MVQVGLWKNSPLIKGSFKGSRVTQTINYVECHDNHTLWDKLQLTNPELLYPIRKKMHQLATGLTLLSQGVPFLHAGQEWFRTKNRIENSYNSSDEINKLNWKLREVETENIDFVKSLIHLRKKYNHFRMDSPVEINQRIHVLKTPQQIFGFTILGDETDFLIYVNPTDEKVQIHLPSSSIWQLMVTNDKANREDAQDIIGEYAIIYSYEFLVLMKSHSI